MQVECKVVHPVSGKRHFQNQSQMKWPQLAEEAQDFCHTRLAQVICALGIKPASTKPPSKAASNLPRVAFAPSFPYKSCLFALSSQRRPFAEQTSQRQKNLFIESLKTYHANNYRTAARAELHRISLRTGFFELGNCQTPVHALAKRCIVHLRAGREGHPGRYYSLWSSFVGMCRASIQSKTGRDR